MPFSGTCNNRNVTMKIIKCNYKVVYARNRDVPQKAFSERSHFLYCWREPGIVVNQYKEAS